jgi:phage-related protein
MKPLEFVGSSLDDLREFPAEARRVAGFELSFVQRGVEPSDWKPMKEVAQVSGRFASMCWANGAYSM